MCFCRTWISMIYARNSRRRLGAMVRRSYSSPKACRASLRGSARLNERIWVRTPFHHPRRGDRLAGRVSQRGRVIDETESRVGYLLSLIFKALGAECRKSWATCTADVRALLFVRLCIFLAAHTLHFLFGIHTSHTHIYIRCTGLF